MRIANLKLSRTLSSNGWMKYGIQTLSLPIEWFLASFQYAGISSSDHQFRDYEVQEKGRETIELDHEEALNQNNDYETSSESDK